jgi:hypothetical protein
MQGQAVSALSCEASMDTEATHLPSQSPGQSGKGPLAASLPNLHIVFLEARFFHVDYW